ncbi:unnamed protein product [Protopolystoma xenopodis]|uniref:Uncharacterized protein n=1 Tax=Protopolystoma xenopodis TaxID=117903 RepID=A0A448X6Z6_9PLAT|nr:unnamed protein product [Protopolystoma xenopodis]
MTNRQTVILDASRQPRTCTGGLIDACHRPEEEGPCWWWRGRWRWRRGVRDEEADVSEPRLPDMFLLLFCRSYSHHDEERPHCWG